MKPELLAFATTALVITASTVLIALHHPVPDWYQLLAAGGLGAGAGVSVPRVFRGQ